MSPNAFNERRDKAIESASAQLLMSHSTNSGVALCLKPSNRRLKLSAASLKNQLRETHISTVFEVEPSFPAIIGIFYKNIRMMAWKLGPTSKLKKFEPPTRPSF